MSVAVARAEPQTGSALTTFSLLAARAVCAAIALSEAPKKRLNREKGATRYVGDRTHAHTHTSISSLLFF